MADELKAKVLAYDFDGLGRDGFARLLAVEERISVPLAKTITREYLRFVYLTQVSDTPLTPSLRVDAAWHLHLTRTRDYWEGLCKGVLGKELHHDADRSDEAATKHNAQYDQTRALYAEVFGETPPAHIWPTAPLPARKKSPWPGLLIGVGMLSFVFGFSGGDDWVLVGSIVVGAVLFGAGLTLLPSSRRRTDSGGASCSNIGASCSATSGRSGSAGSAGFLAGLFGGGDSDGGGASCGGGGCGGAGD